MSRLCILPQAGLSFGGPRLGVRPRNGCKGFAVASDSKCLKRLMCLETGALLSSTKANFRQLLSIGMPNRSIAYQKAMTYEVLGTSLL